MAGVSTPGEASENPVNINIVPMVDVIFCLCVFFFCSFHFRQLEGKLDSWLPNKGIIGCPPVEPIRLEEIRVFLRLNERAASASTAVSRSIGPTPIRDDRHFQEVLLALKADHAASSGIGDVPVIIDAERKVPWRQVVNVMSLAREVGMKKLEFAGATGKF